MATQKEEETKLALFSYLMWKACVTTFCFYYYFGLAQFKFSHELQSHPYFSILRYKILVFKIRVYTNALYLYSAWVNRVREKTILRETVLIK